MKKTRMTLSVTLVALIGFLVTCPAPLRASPWPHEQPEVSGDQRNG